MILRAIACLVIALTPLLVDAAELTLPGGSRQLSNRISLLDSYELPVAAFAETIVPVRHYEGRVDRQTWRIDSSAATTLQLFAPLREQIEVAGYTVVFECNSTSCGGFDFRFNIEIAPAPDMFVDLRNYRYLAAVRGDSEALSLLISVNRAAAYVQVIQVAPTDSTPVLVVPGKTIIPADQVANAVRTTQGQIEMLAQNGHVVLGDLVFETGAAQLGKGPFSSLALLAGYLADTPDLHIAVVGHTDSVGGLGGNIALSKQRATAVRDRLIKDYNISPNRIQAEGMGYLAPIASNLTAKGRDANRRVEVILLSIR